MSSQPSPIRPLYNIALLVGALLFSAFLVEMLMKVKNRDISVDNSSGRAFGTFDFPYRPPSNTMGFREDELGPEIFKDGHVRILFLGDSFTFGHGIEDGANRFSDLIEKRLNSLGHQNPSAYHIYNAGIPGTEPDEWAGYLSQLAPVYAPHYVFAIFFLRDGTALCTSLECHRKEIREIRASYESTIWYKHTNTGKYIGDYLARKAFSEKLFYKIRSSYLGNEKERRPWVEQQKFLLQIRDACQQRGLELHLVIFPTLYDLESEYPFFDVEQEIQGFAVDNGIPTFSLTQGFLGQNSADLWVGPFDQHPNERGHEIAAETLFPYLEEAIRGGNPSASTPPLPSL